MDNFSPKQLILNYVDGWIAGNREQILSTLDPACVVSIVSRFAKQT
jgi:hypothetical protein